MSVRNTLFAKTFCVAGGMIAAGASMLIASGNTAARAAGGDEWQRYSDPKFHVSIERPAGWEVRVDDHTIVVHNADRSAFALIESFQNNSDETAEDHVDNMPASDVRYFQSAHVDDAYSQPVQGSNGKDEEGVGVLSFQGTEGPGQARVLCRVYGKAGIVFAIAAPKGQLASATSTLLHVIQSLRLGGGGGGRQSAGGEAAQPATESGDGGTGAAAPPPAGLDSLTNVKYKHWVDPKEGGFSMDVPVGWKVEGGTSHANPLDYRQSVLVRSPHDEMAVMYNDAAVPSFTIATQTWANLGHPDGSETVAQGVTMHFMHYMPATEFNQWYMDNLLNKAVDDLQVGQVTDLTDLAERMTSFMQKGVPPGSPVRSDATCATTEFTGRSKLNGRAMAGTVYVASIRYIGNARGDGQWQAHPNVFVWATGDDKTEARKAAVEAIYKHMMASFRMNQAWAKTENDHEKQFNAKVRAITNAVVAAAVRQRQMAASMRMSQQNSVASDDRREHMMGSFRAQMAAKDENRRKVVNGILDQTDVASGSGESWKVPSGYNNYYHNERTGTIVGTNDPGNPGVDFTPLTQH